MVTSFGIPTDMKKAMAGAIAAFSIGSAVLPAQPAMAESRLIGEIAGSGLVFKDTLQVESFDDPKVCICDSSSSALGGGLGRYLV
jgi:catabolite regulation protein CreA